MNTSAFDNAIETIDSLLQGPLPAGTVAPDQRLSLHELKPGADGILDALDALADSPHSTPSKNQ